MADVKITALPAAGTIVASSDVLPLVTGGGATTSKATPAQIVTAALIATPAPVAQGGTGASTAATARTNLGLGTMATQASTSVSISGGSIALQALAISGAHTDPLIDGRNLLVVYDGSNNTVISLDQLLAWIQAQG